MTRAIISISILRTRLGVAPCLVLLVIWLVPGLFESARGQQVVDTSELVGTVIEASVTNIRNLRVDGRRFDNLHYKLDWTIKVLY